MDFAAHLMRQQAFSHATYGPGRRTNGVIDHIKKELKEISQSGGSPEEWVDVAILALDGLTRSLAFSQGEEMRDRMCPKWAALTALHMIEEKQTKNERRDWGDWRQLDPNKAIEHVRGIHD